MNLRHIATVLLLMLTLTACGGQPNTSATISSPVPAGSSAAANAAAASPEDTVDRALESMTQKDQATLTDLFDRSVGTYAYPFAHAAIDRWSSLQGAVMPLATIALGPMQSRTIGTPEMSGETAHIVVAITYQIGKADWIFSLRQRDQVWKLLEITSKAERTSP